MSSRTFVAAAAAGILFSAPGAAAAVTIPGLFNTGVDANGVALVGLNGVTDPHWVIHATTISGNLVGEQAVTFRHVQYAANDADSRWISVNSAGGSTASVDSVTTYRLTFDLTGLDHTSAAISGRWGADNEGVIVLNGVDTSAVLGGGIVTSNFSVLHDFSLTSGFVAGLNTLDVRVTNHGSVTGVRIDTLQGSADLLPTAAVPEPATWAMMILGLLGAGSMISRRRALPATS